MFYMFIFNLFITFILNQSGGSPLTLITLDISHKTGHSNYSVQNLQDETDDSDSELIESDESIRNCPKCGCGVVNRKMRIVGGVPAELNEFPWMVALSRRGKFYCGATLITKQHLMTAAHCLEGVNARDIRATLGEYDRNVKNSTQRITVRIKEAKRHPDFQISNFRHDIAILKLQYPIEFVAPSIQPSCLPNTKHRNYTNIIATVSGWGRTKEDDSPSPELRKVEIPILSTSDCRANSGYISSRITDNMICVGYPEGQKDSCQGDSGGPLHIPGKKSGTMDVIGIVSWGKGCARPGFPGIYTRVENYMDWVNDNVDDECTCTE